MLSNKLEVIWNLLTINNRQTLIWNIYVPPDNNKILQELDSELEHHTETPLIILGDSNARHPAWDHNAKTPNRNGEILTDLISKHNLEVHNDGINIFTHPNGSIIIDLVLTRHICNIKCHTKNLDLISTCHMGIEINLAQQTINIKNKRYKIKGADWKKWENDITLSLNEGFQEKPNLSSKSDIDNSVAKLTNIIIRQLNSHWVLQKLTVMQNSIGINN